MFVYPFCFPHSAGFNPRTHTGCDTNELYGVNKFKSIKVRLKLTPSIHCQMCPKFQFHKGPIKAEQANTYNVDYMAFQFHEGPIKTSAFSMSAA